MTPYEMTWVTAGLATGRTPASDTDLDSVRAQGVHALVDLDEDDDGLSARAEAQDFEVRGFPVFDEVEPDADDLEQTLAWLDEATYLGKKVLIHSRRGLGPPRILVTLYMLRRGMDLQRAAEQLSVLPDPPPNPGQANLLQEYERRTGTLRVRPPSAENRRVTELHSYFARYERLLAGIDEARANAIEPELRTACPRDETSCCYRLLNLTIIEVVYLIAGLNRAIRSETRLELIAHAVEVHRQATNLQRTLPLGADLAVAWQREEIVCPLNRDGQCWLAGLRPLECRVHDLSPDAYDADAVAEELELLSSSVFFALTGLFLEKDLLEFSMAEAISGKYVQTYFNYLAPLLRG